MPGYNAVVHARMSRSPPQHLASKNEEVRIETTRYAAIKPQVAKKKKIVLQNTARDKDKNSTVIIGAAGRRALIRIHDNLLRDGINQT